MPRLSIALLYITFVFAAYNSAAQTTGLDEARTFAVAKNYDKAIPLYAAEWAKMQDAGRASLYEEYYNLLLNAKKYKDAEKLVQGRIAMGNTAFSTLEIDLGRVYQAEGKTAKATEQFENSIKKLNGDDGYTQRMARAFADAGLHNYSAMVYERAGQLLGNPFIYALPLTTAYAKADQVDKALEILLSLNANQFFTEDNVKMLLLQWIGNDQKKLLTAQKILMRQINAQPANSYYSNLLTWIFTQKNDWDGALIQMEALDERENENGQHLMEFGRIATTARQYDIAVKAFEDVTAKGNNSPMYAIAKAEILNTLLKKTEHTPVPAAADIATLMKAYADLFTTYPQYYATQQASDYARVAALYADSVNLAMQVLQKAIKYPDTRRDYAGRLKLQLGDYHLLQGRIWDASLLYSQVDKDFKQDVLGEEARFRNAKLAYYRGDFEWAQRLLTVLKASTTELIANDALFLSVQITENIEDSLKYPLARFAYAGLLEWQNKDAQAETLLDSIAAAFPKHPLQDDLLMEHAKIAEKRHQFDKALGWLGQIVANYGQDILGDDALFHMAEIYQNDLNDKEKAKKYYEQLIIDFPGSTYVQLSRKRLKEMVEGVEQ
jgi:hypothetical protein